MSAKKRHRGGAFRGKEHARVRIVRPELYRWFTLACELAGVEPTWRQLSKFGNNQGKASRFKREARVLLEAELTQKRNDERDKKRDGGG